MRVEDGLRGAHQGDNERRDGAEAEKHEAIVAVPGGESSPRQTCAWEGADEVELADDVEPWRAVSEGIQLSASRLLARRPIAGAT